MKRSLFALGFVLLANCATAGVYIETGERDIKTLKPNGMVQKMYIQGGVGRMEAGGESVSIMKGETMYVLDTKRKTYMVFDKASVDAMAKRVSAMMADMKAQMAKMPPEQRAQMEKMMGGALPGGSAPTGKLTSIDVGRTEKVEGRNCRIWQIKRDGLVEDELCVAPYASLPGTENVGALFQKFSKIFEGMSTSMPSAANDMQAYTRVNGYPVRVRGYTKGKLDATETVLKAWREQPMAPSLFVIPAGYKKQVMPGATGG